VRIDRDIMNYRQTIDFLFSSLPMFQRIGDAAIRKDLTNIRKLCTLLQQPQEHFPTIHIAGTNGKGSTSHMLASVFQAAGKKTGLYTSPHYVDFRERIKINGVMISHQQVIRFVEQYKDQWQDIQPSFFEITVAMAFDHFRKQKVDIAIIETGLGGRLDSTNIIQPLLSVITNIGFDHTQFLGTTLEQIAFEKAGIIKPKIPVVIGEWNGKTAPVFKAKAKQENAPIHFASKHLQMEPLKKSLQKNSFAVHIGQDTWIKNLSTDLTGPYQEKNMATVLETMWCWNKYYPQQAISYNIIKRGLAAVKSSTHMIGRWMIIGRNPLIIADAAHNDHGMKAMLPELLNISVTRRHFVLGFVNDKDILKILKLFPEDGQYYWCSPDIPRGKPAQETKEIGASVALSGQAYASVAKAYQAAIKQAGNKDLIFVGGSSYVVGDFLNQKRLQR
jgi:dihydrofolate synthase / folylpolyglutamate synthase